MASHRQRDVDILLYAHDGRGLGHIARSSAIALALKRLDPSSRVLLVSGSADVHTLAPPSLLDWVKLPSYKSKRAGDSIIPCTGPNGIPHEHLRDSRCALLEAILGTLRPAIFLVDHLPRGKDNELTEALLFARRHSHTKPILGLRGVVGFDGSPVWHEVLSHDALSWTSEVFDRTLVYTDASALDAVQVHPEMGCIASADDHVGYVSRFVECRHVTESNGTVGCDVFVNLGAGFDVTQTLDRLLRYKSLRRPREERWLFGIGSSRSSVTHLSSTIASDNCSLTYPTAGDYVRILGSCKAMISFAGYNSIVDAWAASIPTYFLVRPTPEGDQYLHVASLHRAGFLNFFSDERHLGACHLDNFFERSVQTKCASGFSPTEVDVGGADKVAKILLSLI